MTRCTTTAIAPIVAARPVSSPRRWCPARSRRLAHARLMDTSDVDRDRHMAESGLAAGLAWGVAQAVTGTPDPVLAPLTALVVVQVSVHTSIRTTLQTQRHGGARRLSWRWPSATRSISMASLLPSSSPRRSASADVVLRTPTRPARQVPVRPPGRALGRGVEPGATPDGGPGHASRSCGSASRSALAAGVTSWSTPASTLQRLADGLQGVLETMGSGLQQPWSTDQTEDWRRTARTSAIDWSTKPPRPSATGVSRPAGMSTISATSTCSVAMRM